MAGTHSAVLVSTSSSAFFSSALTASTAAGVATTASSFLGASVAVLSDSSIGAGAADLLIGRRRQDSVRIGGTWIVGKG